jgi:GntR family transcriptional regulator
MLSQGSALSKDAPAPLYHQLKEAILHRMRSGEWRPNDRLPAEDELAQQYLVSKATVRQALSELAQKGYVRRVQGLGTFVTEPEVQQGPRELTSFTQETRKRGARPSSRVLIQDVVAADGAIAAALRLIEGTRVFRLKRLRCADGEPMGLQTAYLPLDLVPDIVGEDFAEASLYELLGREYGLTPARAEETHFAVALEGEEAALLEAAEGSPALAAERVAFLTSERPFELVRSVMRGDRYRIVLQLASPREAG